MITVIIIQQSQVVLPHLLEQYKHLFLRYLIILVTIGNGYKLLGIVDRKFLHDVMMLEGEVDHLCHFSQLQGSVLVLVELPEDLVDHCSQLVVCVAHYQSMMKFIAIIIK